MVSIPIPSRKDFTRELLALGLAGSIATGGVMLAPAEWFLNVHSIQVVQSDEGKAIVIQARTVWPGDVLAVQWTAQVERIAVDAAGQATGATICSGEGRASVRDDAYEVVRMPLADWVGDPLCDPDPGKPHIAQASWSFEVLGFTKTASKRSAVFTLMDRTVRLDR
jgi:hypothetical protein